MPIVLKSGSLKLLEPSGPVQSCNGLAFTLVISILSVVAFVAFFVHLQNTVVLLRRFGHSLNLLHLRTHCIIVWTLDTVSSLIVLPVFH
jgi:hypothetical protein